MSNPPHVVSSSSGLLRSGYEFLRSLLLDQRYFWALCGIVILGDAFLTQLIIHFIPCQSGSRLLNLCDHVMTNRYRDRLGDLYGPCQLILEGGTELCRDSWPYWSASVSLNFTPCYFAEAHSWQ